MNLSNHSLDPIEAHLAAYVMRTTKRGQVGQCVAMPSQYAVRSGGCVYEVTANHAVLGESLVRLEVREVGGDEDRPTDRRTIVLQFLGGCLDGRTLRSDSANLDEAILTMAYYGLTDRGRVSQSLQLFPAVWRRIQSKCDGICDVAEYRVVCRSEEEQSVTVRLEHSPRIS